MIEVPKVIEVVKGSSLAAQPYIIVGGAPVTEAYAQEIGADGYGANAVSGVEIGLELLGKG